MEAGDFVWDEEAEKPLLKEVNFTAKPGTLTMIVGSVGSGRYCHSQTVALSQRHGSSSLRAHLPCFLADQNKCHQPFPLPVPPSP